MRSEHKPVLGLLGGMGSGKSRVAELLAQRGGRIVSGDRAAQASNCCRPRCFSPSGSRNRCIVNISTIVLLIGVPVANVTPWPG